MLPLTAKPEGAGSTFEQLGFPRGRLLGETVETLLKTVRGLPERSTPAAR